MKRTTTLFFILLTCFYIPTLVGQDLKNFFKQTDNFFAAYAQRGNVKYKELHKKPDALDILVSQIKRIDLSKASDTELKAFNINAYNLLVIKNVIDYYPIASPNEIVEFWDEIEHTIANKQYTLEAFEQYILEQHNDALLHFVLVNGSVGSAPIPDFAYLPETLEMQIKNHVIQVFNNSKYIQYNPVSQEVLLSRTFKNHSGEFQPSILEFINEYRAQKIDLNTEIEYRHYDWTLNKYYGSFDYSMELPRSLKANKNRKKPFRKEFLPNAQVITLPKNTVELLWFNNIFTATYGDDIYGSRSSFYNSLLTANYGISGKLDVGLTFLLRSSRTNDQYKASPFKVFEFERTSLQPNPRSTGVQADWGFSHVGTQVRFAPFKRFNMSFEQGILFPIKGLPSGNEVDDAIYSISQIYFMHSFNAKLQLFMALTFWQPISPNRAFSFNPPMLRGILNYFVTQRFYVYVSTMYFLEWGGGIVFRVTPKLEAQAMYSYFLPIPGVYDIFSPGATSIMTYNLGFRYRF